MVHCPPKKEKASEASYVINRTNKVQSLVHTCLNFISSFRYEYFTYIQGYEYGKKFQIYIPLDMQDMRFIKVNSFGENKDK